MKKIVSTTIINAALVLAGVAAAVVAIDYASPASVRAIAMTADMAPIR
jgi:hypothetical protein